MNIQYIIYILLGAFILYRIFLRVNRTFKWHALNPKRLWSRTIIFIVIGAIFLFEGGLHPISLISDLIGVLLGVGLAYYGTALTQFERREGQLMYRANAWIGSVVTVLFLGRLIYRIYEVTQMDTSAGTNPFSNTGSSWSSGLMLIMFAYYVVNNLLLMRKAPARSR